MENTHLTQNQVAVTTPADPGSRQTAAPATSSEPAAPLGETELSALAANINREHVAVGEAIAAGLEHARRAGELLAQAKTLVGHGEWLPWLNNNFVGARRTAQAYMRIAARHAELGNAQRVALLTVRDALRLLAEPKAPEAEEPTVAAAVGVTSPSPDESATLAGKSVRTKGATAPPSVGAVAPTETTNIANPLWDRRLNAFVQSVLRARANAAYSSASINPAPVAPIWRLVDDLVYRGMDLMDRVFKIGELRDPVRRAFRDDDGIYDDLANLIQLSEALIQQLDALVYRVTAVRQARALGTPIGQPLSEVRQAAIAITAPSTDPAAPPPENTSAAQPLAPPTTMVTETPTPPTTGPIGATLADAIAGSTPRNLPDTKELGRMVYCHNPANAAKNEPARVLVRVEPADEKPPRRVFVKFEPADEKPPKRVLVKFAPAEGQSSQQVRIRPLVRVGAPPAEPPAGDADRAEAPR
jgi:hypothetical protein